VNGNIIYHCYVTHKNLTICSDNFNRFDFITIAIGIVETITAPPEIIDGNPGKISPFAALRALRALKIAKSWKSLNRLLLAIFEAMGEIMNFLVFLILFIYIYALMGMEVSTLCNILQNY